MSDNSTGVGARALLELQQALAAGNDSVVSGLLDDRFAAMLVEDALAVRDSIHELPGDFYLKHPRHLMTKSLAEAMGHVHVVDVDVRRRFVEWAKTSQFAQPRDSIALTVEHMRSDIAAARWTEAAEHAHAIQRQLGRSRDVSGFPDIAPLVLLRAGQAMLYVGDSTAAAHAFGEAHRWANAQGRHPIDAFVRDHLAISDALAGGYHLAASRIVPTDEYPTTAPGTSPHSFEIVGRLVRAMLSVELMRPDSAELSVAAVALDQADTDMWWLGAHAHARHELLWGNPLPELTRLEQRIRNQPTMTDLSMLPGRLLHADAVSLHQMLGNMVEARLLLDKVRSHGEASTEQIAAQARQLLLDRRYRQALDLLRYALRSGDRKPALRVLRLSGAYLQDGDVSAQEVDSVASLLLATGAYGSLQEAVPEVQRRLLARVRVHRAPSNAYPFPQRQLDVTERERDVLVALRDHSSVREIARLLGVSENTVKTHKRGLYRKLGVKSRAEALAVAAHHRVLG
ncbi:LuxR C-terminal-related transcriptional regulator [Microbacterium esteraromaticum]|uniref:helix-turn-helix transcriptional regulator n=1 Tax=Microbacterium esteraromaticum TaxID=57043 RepID=UPI001C93B7FE|nr:LuxR C-terminal-related transcriptional regulator [Microbacterium esteraromaticum]MBY6061005.1 LuxR C-terminal-related transcriptional regulator [Microbacterium esteraromaticum]